MSVQCLEIYGILTLRCRQTICTFLFLETHRKLYRKMNGIEEKE